MLYNESFTREMVLFNKKLKTMADIVKLVRACENAVSLVIPRKCNYEFLGVRMTRIRDVRGI